MIDTGVYILICYKPVQKFPPHKRQITSWLDGVHETQRPVFSQIVLQSLKYTVFQSCKHLRDTEARFILSVLTTVYCAADRTASPVFPILSFYYLIGKRMRLKLRNDFRLGN